MEIKTATDPAANLSNFRTYAWAPPPPIESGMTQNSMLDETVRADVDRNLTAKGMAKVDPSKADLLVSYTAVAKNTLTYGVAPGPWLWGPDYDVYPQRVGSLTLQFVDPKTNRTVWQGTAADTIGDAGTSQKEIGTAVTDLLKKYNPVG